MRIAISGKSGCGNSSVSAALAKRLNYTLINYTFRNMAKERGIDFWDFCKLAKKDYSIDKDLDKKQREMALREENCVLGSRLAIWVLKEADVKIYLHASEEVRVKRILQREGGTFQEKLKETQERDESDTKRFKEIYSIDNNNPDVANIHIPTDDVDVEKIVDIILISMEQLNKKIYNEC